MKLAISLALVIGFIMPLPSIAKSPTAVSNSTPNVIYILADDLGIGDLSIYGQQKLKTPNIDSIGQQGIKFTDHYSGNTVCSPSRAVLMTGQSASRVYIHGNGEEAKAALDANMITLPRLFKNAGYATGAFGKWGLGHTHEGGNQSPLTHGFDTFTGWTTQWAAHTYYPTSIVRDGKEVPLKQGTYIHDEIMQDAFSFIEKNAANKTPFFAYIPTAIPHAAMHAPKHLHEKWRKVFPQFDHIISSYDAREQPCPDVQNPIAGFAGMIEHLDNQIGELLAKVKALGIDDNTLIVFTSDNGAHLAGGHNPKFWNSNGNFRGHKRDLYEGGIRTPMLARWPGKIKAGSTSQHISAFWDVLPTMAKLIGQDIPPQTDGISMLPTLTGNGSQQQHDHLYWRFKMGDKITSQAVRMGDWKIVQIFPWRANKIATGKIKLFNLAKDISETTDLAEKYPNIVKKVAKHMLHLAPVEAIK